MRQPRLRVLLLAVALLTAGCVSPLSDGPEESGASAAGTTVVPEATYPAPPSNLTNDTVTQAALEYEAARLQNYLRDEYTVTSFDFGYLRPPNATVLNQSDSGLYVKIDATYSYTSENVASDFNPVCSLYFVNRTTINYVAESTCEE